ncbi:aspartyl/glutamyl-tRNA(Asn/Gln) amidotransferase subunit A [Rhizobium sp. RU35A]|uniref:amidase n=1 Tax=Rhizobium sp. RU35A TaxID=1907414 RepID=UPI0009565E8D|nr:amidase [Rhizobium sp. RU35A]SIQ37287.1 aspartyl/glutamyl-tRNA(Asn/Gln) amidotransferase subunit A [Rhizobium sp. RU35A]
MSVDTPSTLTVAAAAIRNRTISSVELTQAALERAEASQPRLNAFLSIDHEHALDRARAADRALAAGHVPGPLHGVPLAHKDMFDVEGRITGCGSRIRAGHVARDTSTVMARLEAAGSLSIGRLNMSEFAMGPTGHNHHHGRAINPIDPARVTGGSSSGSGAAVGGGVVLAALGSDTGGSIRLPAACCGTVGIKPTQGRVSRHGAMPLSFSQDCIGPLAANVEDAWLMLSLISGPDGIDPTCMAAPLGSLSEDLSSLRIGLATGAFTQSLSADVGGAMQQVANLLDKAVKEVRDVALGALEAVTELANAVAMTEAAAVHFDGMRERPEDYGPQVRMRISQGLAVPGPVYVRALQIRAVMLARFLDEVFGVCDVLMLPAMPFVAPLDREVDVGAGQRMNEVVSAMTSLTRPFSYLGLPVVTLPVAVGREGMPVAIQLVARPWREDLAASVARHLEHALALSAFHPSQASPTAA